MEILKLPGLIDPHVHLRDPGQTQKEDFTTGTMAALAGGYTTVIDMPNNTRPIFTKEALQEKIKTARNKVLCSTGFYFGSTGENIEEFTKVENEVFGLKVYLNKTTGNFITQTKYLTEIFSSWTEKSPVLLHAIDETVDAVIETLKKTPRPIHICHVSSKHELSRIIEAKNENLPITCGVTPHHLFLTDSDREQLGPFGLMQPPLRKREDVEYLWKNISFVDMIESDHAPHTKEEKEESQNVPFGVPGLETTLFLLLTEYKNGKITLEEIKRLCHTGPQNVFKIPSSNSEIEVDLSKQWEIKNENLKSKSKWTPFAGRLVWGVLKKVYTNRKLIWEDGNLLTTPGDGQIISPNL